MSRGITLEATVTVAGGQQLAVENPVTSRGKALVARVALAANQTIEPGAVNE